MDSGSTKSGQRSYYVVVEGPIGVGKTTLVHKLSARLRSREVLEVFEENPFLADFYEDRARYAFQTEMFFALNRYRQLEALSQPDLFAPYTIADYLFQKSLLFARETLREHEYELFRQMFRVLDQNIPKPDLVIHLTAPIGVLLERIRKRGRPYEQNMDPNYLENLGEIYDRHFSQMDGTPLVTVDTTDLNFTISDAAVDMILQLIHNPPVGRVSIKGPAISQASFAF